MSRGNGLNDDSPNYRVLTSAEERMNRVARAEQARERERNPLPACPRCGQPVHMEAYDSHLRHAHDIWY